MGKKQIFEGFVAAAACVIFSPVTLADDASVQVVTADSHNLASPTLDALGEASTVNVRTSPIVIMADDQVYQEFRQEYQAQNKLKAGIPPVIDNGRKIERVLELALPIKRPTIKNNSQLFVFKNITEITTPDTQPAVPLLNFRLEQIESLKQVAAGKKAP